MLSPLNSGLTLIFRAGNLYPKLCEPWQMRSNCPILDLQTAIALFSGPDYSATAGPDYAGVHFC